MSKGLIFDTCHASLRRPHSAAGTNLVSSMVRSRCINSHPDARYSNPPKKVHFLDLRMIQILPTENRGILAPACSVLDTRHPTFQPEVLSS